MGHKKIDTPDEIKALKAKAACYEKALKTIVDWAEEDPCVRIKDLVNQAKEALQCSKR